MIKSYGYVWPSEGFKSSLVRRILFLNFKIKYLSNKNLLAPHKEIEILPHSLIP